MHRATLISGASRRALPAPRVGGGGEGKDSGFNSIAPRGDVPRARNALEGAADASRRRVTRVYIITNGIPDFRGIPAPVQRGKRMRGRRCVS